MRKLVLAALAALLLASPALAKEHHANARHYRGHSHHHVFRHRDRHGFAHRKAYSADTAQAGRPAGCAGIPWCGCWMRAIFGVADKSFNVAARWATYGQPTSAHAGAIVVYRHHVALIRGECRADQCVMISGNDGHRVRTRARSLHGAIAIRQPPHGPMGFLGSFSALEPAGPSGPAAGPHAAGYASLDAQ